MALSVGVIPDVLDVPTPERPYKVAYPLEGALQIIVESSALHFDPDVVVALKAIYDRVEPDQILGLADPIDPMRDINSL